MWNRKILTVCTVFLAVLQLSVQQDAVYDNIDSLKNLFLQVGSQTDDCDVYPRSWIYEENNYNITERFRKYERSLQLSCKSISDFYLFGNFLWPSLCETFNLCNSTYCLRFENEGMKFLYLSDRSCAGNLFTQDTTNTYIDLNYMLLPYLQFSQYHSLVTLENLEDSNENQTSDSSKLPIVSNKDLNVECEKIKDVFVLGLKSLPDSCSDIRLCHDTMCYVFPQTTYQYAKFYRIRDPPGIHSYDLPSECPVLQNKRTKRAAFPQELNYTTFTMPRSVWHFNLPGYRYCGPGTDIEVMDDNGGPINDLDDLCRSHDVDYMTGVYPPDADAKLLEGMWDLQHPYLPLFVAALEAKRYFENIAGELYTSSLYYFPERQKSLTYELWQQSVYDNKHTHLGDNKIGLDLETRWKKLLHGIWLGHCYASTYSPNTLANGPGSDTPSAGQPQPQQSETQSGSQQQPSSSRGSTSSQAVDSEISSVSLDKYPPIPTRLDKCRMILSEVLPKYPQDSSFLEIQKVCPPAFRNLAKRLFDYHILIVRISDPSTIYMSYNLHTHEMRQVKELGLNSRTPRNNYYFVIGSDDLKPDLSFSNIREMDVQLGVAKGVPAEASSTYAIILLHFPTAAVHKRAETSFHMEIREDNFREKIIAEEQLDFIQKYVQDIIIYGAPCDIQICEDFRSLIPVLDNVEQVNNYFIPIPYPMQPAGPTLYSINRCTDKVLPMQLNDYAEGIATPGSRNNCPPKGDSQRFNLRGTTLQSTAQKVIVNAHDFFHRYITNPVILEGNEVTLTAKVCSISEISVKKILENWRKGTILTPGKKRPHPLYKQCQLDDFDLGMIRRTIQEIFAAKQVPFVSNVFAKFKQKMLETEAVRRQNGEQVVPFSCGEKTFRRILHRMGFHFGKIDYRAVLLIKPNIVMWRGKYLQALKKNREKANPMKVLYLDETWIDPHARTGKAWVPKKCKNYREAALYAPPGHKPSRGPRLIVLNAGGEDGMFHPAMEVFPVHKADVKGDYHDNVNGKYYMGWFSRLLDELDKTGNKYIIVQDNAPYHGTSDIPKQRDRKEIMYNWLAENLPVIHLPALEPVENYRKFELWAFVKQLKASKNFFTIDKMAEQRGHRVLRLPPYNCDLNPIEFVWKDIKDAVKKQNVNQNLRTIEELAKKVMLEYPVEKWRKHVGHVEKIGKEYWDADGMYENFMENEGASITIPIDDDDDEEDEDREYTALAVDPDVVTSLVHDQYGDDDNDELLDI